MALDPTVLVVAMSPALTAGVLGWWGWQQRRNGRNSNGRPRDPEHNPYETRLGDVPVAWWIGQQKETIGELKKMRKAVEAHMKKHHG